MITRLDEYGKVIPDDLREVVSQVNEDNKNRVKAFEFILQDMRIQLNHFAAMLRCFPEDALLMGIENNFSRRTCILFIRSQEFDVVLPGAEAPVGKIVCKKYVNGDVECHLE